MQSKLILALDLGTQSARASLIDDHGNIKALSKVKYNPLYLTDEKGVCEQHPDVYFDYIKKALLELKNNGGEYLKDIGACVLTTFRDTAVFLDENNEVLRPCILWLDQRIATEYPTFPLWKKLAFKLVHMTSFIRFQQMKTAIHWVKQHQRDIFDKTKKYVNISTYLNYKLTGELVDTPAAVIGHYPLEYRTGKWYSHHSIKYGVFDIKESTYCTLKKPGEILGYLKKDILDILNIDYQIPLIGSGSDKSCESLGNGCIDETFASISYGTASTVTITSKKYVEPSPFLPAYTAAQKGYFNSELQIYRGYWMLNWFKDEFCKDEIKKYPNEHAFFDYLDRVIEKIPPGDDGLILQPYWGPCLERPNARGAILGFSERHDKYHIYRAIIEGIAYCLKEGFERIQKKEDKKVKYLVCSGGGSTSDIVLQITADIFNLPVYRAPTTETSSLGAAIVGFMSLKRFSSYQEAKDSMVHYQKEFLPIKENHQLYQKLYEKVYLKMYKQLKNIDATLREFTNERF